MHEFTMEFMNSLVSQVFDPENYNWSPDEDTNMCFIEMTKVYQEERRRVRGFVLLGEMYEALGFKAEPEYFRFGWKGNPVDLEFEPDCVNWNDIIRIHFKNVELLF